jgi:hypothetical protein
MSLFVISLVPPENRLVDASRYDNLQSPLVPSLVCAPMRDWIDAP